MSNTVLILGGTGRFGRHATDAFFNQGWTIRQFNRKTDTLPEAVKGVDVILNAWNPAYPDWAKQVPVFTKEVIKAAKASNATVIIPGNVYNFGPDAPATFTQTTPHRATNPLGRIRIEMENAYRAAGVQTIILRAGDFIDTDQSGNWFDMIMTAKLDKGIFTYPGNPDIAHAWAWLPDLGKATVQLAEMRGRLSVFNDIPFAGYTMTGTQLLDHITNATDTPIKLKQMNWLPLRLFSPFWPLARNLVQMRYLWNKPHTLDGQIFNTLLPDFKLTPVTEAIAQALK